MVVNKMLKANFNKFLVENTGCEIQEGADGLVYPCGTCVMAMLDSLGLDKNKPEYNEKNPEHDRHNEVWRAILQIRDANQYE